MPVWGPNRGKGGDYNNRTEAEVVDILFTHLNFSNFVLFKFISASPGLFRKLFGGDRSSFGDKRRAWLGEIGGTPAKVRRRRSKGHR